MNMTSGGATAETVLEELQEISVHDVKWEDGRLFALAFMADETGKRLAEEAYRMFMWQNCLDPMAFPSLMRFERDVVGFAVAHLRADPSTAVGTFTSGGTESVCLAVLAARNWAREHRPQISLPKMIVPVTVHPAFHKAAHYFGVEVVSVPVDPTTCRADVDAMAAAIDERTILLVGSAPSYAHGVIDPIPAIAGLARAHGLLCHVDGCVGGFVLPFLRELGHRVPEFDFQVPGVTSMSMDFHKYAYAPKGASVVVFRDPELRCHQIFTFSAWPGYTMVNPTMQSSRSGGPLAGTWALLRHYGRDGYREIVRSIKEATDRLIAGIEAIDGLYVIGEPGMTLIGAGSRDFSIFAVCEALAARGWHVHPQMGLGDLSASFHLTVMPQHVPHVDAFLAALAESVAEVSEKPAEPEVGLMAMLGDMDLSGLSGVELEELLQSTGLVGEGAAAAPSAEVNEILDSLPSADADRLVRTFYDLMSRPTVGAR